MGGVAPGITTAKEYLPCGGCKEDTKVRFNGQPYHFGCVPAEARNAAPALKLAFLEDLHDTWAPKKRVAGKLRAPWWAPPMPEITDRVEISGGNWRREGAPADQPRVVLDRTAAFLSAAASVEVAHGALVHTEGETSYRGLPGFYKVMWHPWEETRVPHPLGSWDWRTSREHERWVPHIRAALLQQLADAGRYPDGFITDAYTCAIGEDGKPQSVRLEKWATHVQATRKAVIERFGRASAEYEAVKTNYSQAVAMMTGRWEAGRGRTYHPSCRVRRPDWGMAIADLSAVTLWKWCDDARQVVTDAGRLDLTPVELRNVDELVVPAEAVELLTTLQRSGGRRPMTIDPDGIKLGTFKVKADE